MLKNNPLIKVTWIFRLGITALLCLSVVACGKNNQAVLAHKTLLYCSEGSPETFNPQLVTSGTTIDAVSQQLYNRLVKINPETGLVVSDLARKVIVSKDAMRYRFYLRKDVEFHSTKYFTPTRPLTSEDILFTFSRILHLDHEYNMVGGGLYPFFNGMGFDTLIEQIIVVDDLTIEFRLSEPQASFLANMATDFAVILSAEYAEQLITTDQKELIDQLPIGTGPFKFNEYKRDHYIRYNAHKNYWDGQPKLEQVIYDITPNNSNRVAKLLTKECDVLGYPSSADVEFLKQKKDIDIVESVSMNVSYWAFNTNVPPFDNANVRKALSYVVDRQAIIDAVYFNHAEPASTLVPPSSWAYSEENTDVEMSLEKARALLIQEGFAEGFEMDIWAMPVQRVYNPNATKMAEILQQNLAQVGVKANIVSYDWGTFRKKLAKGEHDSVLIGWLADNSDPDNFYRPLLSCAAAFSGSNRSAWCNDDYDKSILNALTTPDPEIRKEYYKQAEKLIYEYSPLVPIAHALRYQVHRNYVEDVEFNPYGGIGFFQAYKGQN